MVRHGRVCFIRFWNDVKKYVDKTVVNYIFQDMIHHTYKDFKRCYTDGSKTDNAVGAAVFIEDEGLALSWKLDSNHSILMAELFAIYNCLVWLLQSKVIGQFVIFTDSLAAITLIGNSLKNTHKILTSKIQRLLFQLRDSCTIVVIQWIPSHTNVHGNEMADLLAKNACEYDVVTFLVMELEELFVTARQNIMSHFYCQQNADKDSSCLGRLLSSVKDWDWLTSGNRHCDVILAKLRNNVARLNSFLHIINLSDSPHCIYCLNTLETPQHYLLECPRYVLARNKMFARLKELGLNNNNISMSILLSGSDFSPNKRRKIMYALYTYFTDTDKLNIL